MLLKSFRVLIQSVRLKDNNPEIPIVLISREDGLVIKASLASGAIINLAIVIDIVS